MEKIYRMELDFGRMGDISGIFVADDKEVEKLYGKTIYFGEILGKHSDIEHTIERDDVVEVPAPKHIVKWFDESVGCIGHNPLTYLEE